MKTSDRTWIVSGGSSGLGLATVRDLLESPKTFVAIVDRSEPPENIPNTLFLKTDITNVEQIQDAVDKIITWTKETGSRLGGVVNCAGVGTAGKIIDSHNEPHSLDLWDFTLAVNLTGTFNLTRLTLKHLIHVEPEDGDDGERGIIIFVSSGAAFEGQPGQTAYSATKGALASMTLPMSRDLSRHAIRVMTIAPGAFESAMTRMMSAKARKSLTQEAVVYPQRFGQPEEFAKACRFIIETPYMNGEVLRLSGAARFPGKL